MPEDPKYQRLWWRIAMWLWFRELEMGRTGIYFILGYKEGDRLPWYSPSRVLATIYQEVLA